MSIYHNDPENVINDPENFLQYRIWILSGHNVKKLHPTTIKVTTSQLYGGSNSHVSTNIKLFNYIRPVQCNVQILNVKKAPTKGFGLLIIKIPKTNIIIPLWSLYYMPQNP